jgi:hypothetical protein
VPGKQSPYLCNPTEEAKMIKLSLMLLPICLWALTFYEASGQTQAFTLAAGNNSGWDQNIAVENIKTVQPGIMSMTLSPNPTNGTLRIGLSGWAGAASVAIYNVEGKKVLAFTLNNRKEKVLTHTLANGVYLARLQANGKIIQTTRFMVVR